MSSPPVYLGGAFISDPSSSAIILCLLPPLQEETALGCRSLYSAAALPTPATCPSPFFPLGAFPSPVPAPPPPFPLTR